MIFGTSVLQQLATKQSASPTLDALVSGLTSDGLALVSQSLANQKTTLNVPVTGSAVLDFGDGETPVYDLKVAITGQGGIANGMRPQAYFMASSMTSNDEDSHAIARTMIDLVCGWIVPGTGFSIMAISDGTVTGRFRVMWRYQ